MREFLTADDICNQISMNRSLFKGTMLISEGNTDQRLYSKFTDPRNVRIIPAHSKSNVLSVVNKMAARRDGKVLGIVDRDLDEMKGRMISPPIFYSDYRDLEMMLINSDALDDVLTEYGDPDRIRRFEKQYGPVKNAIISAAYPVGLLMYVSFIRGYNLNFKDLDFRDFVDKRTLKVDDSKMIQAVISNTLGSEISRKGVQKDLANQYSSHPEKEAIARGHDAVEILLIGLKDIFGSYNASSLNKNALGGVLRIAFTMQDFSKTELYSATKKWADSRNIRLWKINQSRNPLS